MNFISLNGCPEPLHFFAECGEEISCYHQDNTECQSAEFRLPDMDDLPVMLTCPWCDKNTLETDHMRACSGYKTPLPIDEVLDAYSEPTERAKHLMMKG